MIPRPRCSRSTLLLGLGTLVALFSLLGLVTVAWTARREARARFFEQYNRQQLVVAKQAAENIEELFESFDQNLTLAARLLEGVEIASGRRPEIERVLRKLYEGLARPPVAEFTVFDRTGTAVAMAPEAPYTLGRNYAWREYYRWARDRGRPGALYLSPFMRMEGGKYRGEKALLAAHGLYGPGGQFRGVVTMLISFDELVRRHVLSIRMGDHGYAWLLDNNNREILVDPRNKVSGLTFEQAFLPRWPRLYALAQAAGAGRPGADWYDFANPGFPGQGARKLVGHAPIRIGDRLWTLGVCTPMREVEGLMASFLNRLAVLAGLAISITVIGSLVLFGLLHTWNRSLRREVDERTGELRSARERLETAFDELLAARQSAALGRLALGLAHEIRNPLFSIRLNMQMIRRKIRPDGSVGESFSIVEEDIQRLNRLLNQVMGFARPMPLRLETVDPAELARKVLLLLQGRLEHDRIEVTTEIEDLPEIVCDPEQVRQVLLNLVLNAAEAMAQTEGPRRLVVRIEAEPDESTVCFRMTDTGRGLAPEEQEKVFDPFYTTKAEGGGLGLSIAQTIALRHGGTLEAESRPGEGASFLLRLPLRGPPPPQEGKAVGDETVREATA